MSDIVTRALAVDERLAAVNVVRAALLSAPSTPELLEARAESWDDSDALAAWDGDRCVGHLATFRFETTVPGGARLPTAGVTRVGVLPTDTRRGILRQLIERSVREAHERGQVLASLRASEGPIYGRFGFGLGGDVTAALITTATARPFRGTPVPGSVRLLRRDEFDAVLPDLYDRCARQRVGMLTRPPWLWKLELADTATPTSKNEEPAREIAVHTGVDGVDDAYVHYEVAWDDGFAENPHASGKIHELFGVDAEAERAMWAYVLDIDLIRTWQAPARPSDDPIRRAFHDIRAYETRQRWDEQWIRLVDVDAALRARAYGAVIGSVVVEVADPLLGHNTGRWRISADGARRADQPSDVSVDIATLSAAYLGGVSWRDLADSGELAAGAAPDVLARLDALFAVRPAPFCGTDF